MAKERIVFNPVKEEKDSKSNKVIWSTESLDLAINALGEGKRLKVNPFYERNTKILKGDLVFQRTPEEIEEWKRCREDILYFADNYAKLMTPQGIKNVTLRDYQEDYLRHLDDARLSIMLSCRQAGKCFTFDTLLIMKANDDLLANKKLADKLNKLKKQYYYINKDVYIIPYFELMNLFNKGPKWRLKYILYKILYKYGENKDRIYNSRVLEEKISELEL